MTVPVPHGLRERKKQRTRETIVVAATRLFLERGYDATTIADIAEAAEIAPRTFFAYFPSKEDVLFHEFPETVERFAARLDARDDGETTFDVMRAWITERICDTDFDDDAQRARHRLIRETPALRAHERAKYAGFGSVLAVSVARDLDCSPDALRPQLVSAAASAALEALGQFYEDREPASANQAIAVIDDALVFLRGGLEALRTTPSPSSSARPRRPRA